MLLNNGALLSGIFAASGYGTNVSNNVLRIDLSGCDISNNNAPDIYAYGAFSTTAFVVGTSKFFGLYLNSLSANATFESAASAPAGTNVLNIYK